MKNQRMRQIYIWLISIYGFILVFLTPPLAAPDEHTHFLNAYCFSQFNFQTELDESILQVGKYIPAYIDIFAQKYRNNYAMNLEDGYSFLESYYDSWLPVKGTDRELVFWKSSTINPLAYIVSGLGMKILTVFCYICGKGFDTAYNLMLAGRLANLLFYVLIGYYAIEITPCLKRTMMLILGMPMSLFLGASLSYDAILIPVTMLFFAEFMKLYIKMPDMSVDIKNIITVGFCVLFLVSIKKVCAPFICLLLFVPRTKFKSLKQYMLSVGIVTIIGIIALLPEIIIKFVTPLSIETIDSNSLLQKEYLYHNLYLVPKIILNTFKDYGEFYFGGFVGKLGQLDTNLPIVYIGMFWCILLIVAFIESSIVKIDWKVRIGSLGIVIFIIVVMFMKMYISWTPYVENLFGTTVSGVQGRYFIPLFCFSFIPIFNNLGYKIPEKITTNGSKMINNIVMFSTIINGILTILIILLRYWCY